MFLSKIQIFRGQITCIIILVEIIGAELRETMESMKAII